MLQPLQNRRQGNVRLAHRKANAAVFRAGTADGREIGKLLGRWPPGRAVRFKSEFDDMVAAEAGN